MLRGWIPELPSGLFYGHPVGFQSIFPLPRELGPVTDPAVVQLWRTDSQYILRDVYEGGHGWVFDTHEEVVGFAHDHPGLQLHPLIDDYGQWMAVGDRLQVGFEVRLLRTFYQWTGELRLPVRRLDGDDPPVLPLGQSLWAYPLFRGDDQVEIRDAEGELLGDANPEMLETLRATNSVFDVPYHATGQTIYAGCWVIENNNLQLGPQWVPRLLDDTYVVVGEDRRSVYSGDVYVLEERDY